MRRGASDGGNDGTVAAVIVHYRSADTIESTVDDLSSSIESRRLYVVDNSDDLDAASFAGRATILSPGRNLGYAAAVNMGLRRAFDEEAIDRVIVATHETRWPEQDLSALIAESVAAGRPSIVAPILAVRDAAGEQIIWSAGGGMSRLGYPYHKTAIPTGRTAVLWADGASYVIDRTAWARLGGVPEEFFLYMEDVALGHLARDRGVSILITPRATVVQSAKGPSRPLAVRNRLILARRYMSRGSRLVVLAEFWTRTVILLVIRPRDGAANLRAWRDSGLALTG